MKKYYLKFFKFQLQRANIFVYIIIIRIKWEFAYTVKAGS